MLVPSMETNATKKHAALKAENSDVLLETSHVFSELTQPGGRDCQAIGFHQGGDFQCHLTVSIIFFICFIDWEVVVS